jgi:Ala-tRNA(Pro) deacylase
MLKQLQHQAKKEDAMPIGKLREFLDDHHVRYFIISHSPAYTAQEIAAAAHVSGKELAKTVMVTINGKMAMVVLPASRQLNFEALRQWCGTGDVELAEEEEFSNLFPDCEIGAMPPFGNLYGMDMYVDEELARDEDLVFNAGAHTELVRLSYSDYESLAQPVYAPLALKP